MERIEELCCYYIALIRSVYLVHQNHHWITSGESFYGNHLLFERIYKSAAEDADLAAEKMIGLFGTEVMDLHMQAQMIGKTLEDFSTGNPLGTSLEAEKKFLDFSEKFYKLLKKEDKMSLGLDDMLMSIASNREGAVYLLQQTLGRHEENESRAAKRIALLKNAIDVNEVKRAVQMAIQNASVVKSSGIMPFVNMLQADGATLSINIIRNGNDIEVSNPVVTPGSDAMKYSALPLQIKSYLEKYPELFPTKRNGEAVSYDNMSITLEFGTPQGVAKR